VCNDGVALEDTTCFPTADLHDHAFSDAGPPIVTCCCTAQVVKEQVGNSGIFAGLLPRASKIFHRLAVSPGQDIIIRSLSFNAESQQGVNGLRYLDLAALFGVDPLAETNE
jgi:hypothetical protein